MMRRSMAWPVMLCVMAAFPAIAQGQDGTCETVLQALDATVAEAIRPVVSRIEDPDERVQTARRKTAWCRSLATFIVEHYVGNRYLDSVADEHIPARDLQSAVPQGAATGGSPAQDEAVPSVTPLALAGGTVAAVGTGGGASAITALTLNPSLFFVDPEEKARLAALSRFTDVTAFFPVDGLDEDKDGKVDYFGLRARVNMNALSQGSMIMRRARAELGALVLQESNLADDIRQVLEAAPDVRACVDAFITVNNIEQTCGSDVDVTLDEKQYADFRETLRRAREEADAFYYGIDLRFDFGDPTLGDVPGAAGTGLFGGFAVGKRMIYSPVASLGVRGQLGVRYFGQDDYADSTGAIAGKNDFSLEGAFGFEVMRAFQQQAVRLSSGFEFRVGNPPEGRAEALQTNYLLFRAALNVPVTVANSISIGVGAPLWGAVSPTLSINANWSLLLPDR